MQTAPTAPRLTFPHPGGHRDPLTTWSLLPSTRPHAEPIGHSSPRHTLPPLLAHGTAQLRGVLPNRGSSSASDLFTGRRTNPAKTVYTGLTVKVPRNSLYRPRQHGAGRAVYDPSPIRTPTGKRRRYANPRRSAPLRGLACAGLVPSRGSQKPSAPSRLASGAFVGRDSLRALRRPRNANESPPRPPRTGDLHKTRI